MTVLAGLGLKTMPPPKAWNTGLPRRGPSCSAKMETASSTGLDAMMPGWVQEGGHRAWVERLRDPAVVAHTLVAALLSPTLEPGPGSPADHAGASVHLQPAAPALH